jgi:endonuclease/exonuclease/phosphatase family metal-dependent hydrolase
MPGERRYQVKQLLPLFDDRRACVKVLLGDLNEWFLWGRPLRWLHRIFHHHKAPATFPVRRPWFALDRIWVQPNAVIDTMYAHKTDAALLASDHLPLIANLDIGKALAQ